MKILWVCNTILPQAAEYLNMEGTNKEGWIAGLAERLLREQGDYQVELAVACPMYGGSEKQKWLITGVDGAQAFWQYGFKEDVDHPETYDKNLGEELKKIIEDFQPDLVHCFGTEYPHTLALTKVCDKDKLLIGFQGVCSKLEEVYYADLPEKVIKRVTFRDFLKQDSIRMQKEKFKKRSISEEEAIKAAKHVTGRTVLDKSYALKYNPDIQYHFMNETLRSVFYQGAWSPETCEPHSIMISQGDYPLKGLHYVLKAMPMILELYPDARLYVAGNPIVRPKNLMGALKISSYGKYIMELLEQWKLKDKVVFLGKLNGTQMRERMLLSNVFVCASAAENSPNSLGEAMLLGVPCVTAWVGGVLTVFEDGVDGIAYPGYGAEVYRKVSDPETAQAKMLAQAVIEMWQDEEGMVTYGKNASAHAGITHDGQKNFKRLLEIYREIVG